MSEATLSRSDFAVEHLDVSDSPAARDVVAVVLVCNKRLALLKRSAHVKHDQGRWHCVTGYVEPGTTPFTQALTEVWEETGLRAPELDGVQEGPTLHLSDDSAGPATMWAVHTFVVTTRQRHLRLNDEHTTYRWVPPSKVARFDGQVHWLVDVLRATRLVRRR